MRAAQAVQPHIHGVSAKAAYNSDLLSGDDELVREELEADSLKVSYQRRGCYLDARTTQTCCHWLNRPQDSMLSCSKRKVEYNLNVHTATEMTQ